MISATIPKNLVKKRSVQDTLSAMPGIIESVTITKFSRTIQTEDGEIETTVQTVDPTPQSVRDFGPEEKAWLDQGIAAAQGLGVKYGSSGPLNPAELDVVFSRWFHEEGEKEDGDLIANALGAAYGEWLIEECGFKWVFITDEHGSKHAIRHAVGEVTGFPRSSVQKRIEAREEGFFVNLHAGILDQLRRSTEEDE